MKTEPEIILDKMNKIINTSNIVHKEVVTRYLCLGNKLLNNMEQYPDDFDIWSIAGASTAIKQNYEAKFGTFLMITDSVKRCSVT